MRPVFAAVGTTDLAAALPLCRDSDDGERAEKGGVFLVVLVLIFSVVVVVVSTTTVIVIVIVACLNFLFELTYFHLVRHQFKTYFSQKQKNKVARCWDSFLTNLYYIR